MEDLGLPSSFGLRAKKKRKKQKKDASTAAGVSKGHGTLDGEVDEIEVDHEPLLHEEALHIYVYKYIHK